LKSSSKAVAEVFDSSSFCFEIIKSYRELRKEGTDPIRAKIKKEPLYYLYISMSVFMQIKACA
jgi:hypothetical protein